MSHATRKARLRARTGIALLLMLVAALVLGTFSSLAAADEADVPGGGDEVVALADPDPAPSANNALPDECGLDIVIVLDRSGSTESSNTIYKNAAKAFVNGLVGTPSNIGIVTFSASSSLLSGYKDVSATDNGLNALIDGLPTPNGLTNWQAAMAQVSTSFASPVPQLVLFITDGNPTTQTGSAFGDLGAGIAAANTLKANGVTHITGVGVGTGVNLANIEKIAGAGSGITGNDPDVQASATDTLVDDIRAIATELCGGSVAIHKSVRTGPATTVNGAGWSFASANADTTPVVTDLGGTANFGFDSPDGSNQTFTEDLTGHSGYSLESVTCTKQGDVAVPASNVTTNGFAIPINQEDVISCEVVNTPALGSISVAKETTNGVGGPFEFNVSGPNGTDEDLEATTSQATNPAPAGTVSDLFPGTYTVVETSLPEGATLEDVDCGEANTEPTANGVEVTLAPGEDVSCTFTNDDPVDLSVLKTSSGDPVAGATQLTYTLTVTNNGPGENADPIVVTDTLPAGLGFVSATGTGWDCSNVGNAITCTYDAQLGVGESSAITVVASINAATVSATVQNCATVTDGIEDDTNDTSCVSNTITAVAAVEASQGAAPLAFTGSSPFRAVTLGAVLLGLGLAATLFSRRRKATRIG